MRKGNANFRVGQRVRVFWLDVGKEILTIASLDAKWVTFTDESFAPYSIVRPLTKRECGR